MTSLSFDGLTTLYDRTRTADPACFASALDWIMARFPPSELPTVLEPGIGTGRIALPLAERGYEVTGLDISAEMLNMCAAQSRDSGLAETVHCLRADAAALPFSASAFDLCVAVHLFYFIPKWREVVQEMLRVTRPGGALILLHTGFGTEVPRFNERYQALAQALGYTFPVYGVRSTAEVVEHAVSLGCTAERVEDAAWHWTTPIKQHEALDYLEARAYSFTKEVPTEVHQAVMEALYLESADLLGGLDPPIEVPNRISIVIVSLPLRKDAELEQR